MGSRLLYLIGQLSPGGSELQLFYLLRSMDRERYRPAVVVWNRSGGDKYLTMIRDLNIPVYSFSKALSATAKIRACRSLVLEIQPEVVHSYSFYLNVCAHYVSQGVGAIAVGSNRSNLRFDLENMRWWLARLSVRWPITQVYNSYEAANTARCLKSPFVAKRIIVIRNGVDLEQFKRVHLLPTGKLEIFGVGSLVRVKRWDRLLRAARNLREQGYDFAVRIVGEGPLRSVLEQEVKDLGISGCVTLTGYSNDIPRLLSRAALLVHTSDVEGCPNAVMEAMACGRPVVATNVGDIPYLVDNGKTGFVVGRCEDGALVERVARLLRDIALCRSMGDAGRSKAEREFGLDRLVTETFAAYRAAGWKDA